MDELTTIETPRHPVTKTYQGVDVTDDYAWLEDASSEETRLWTKAQQERTTSYFAGLSGYADIRRRAEEIIGAASTSYADLTRGGVTFFALKHQPPKQQPFLVAVDDVENASSERVVVDPNQLDASGATTIDWYVPSPDGRMVAVSLSSHGTENGTLHLFEVSSGALVDVRIPQITMMGGSLAWRGDSGGFWYTRYPAPDERPEQDLVFFQEVWFHELGTTEDRCDLAGVFADERIAENVVSSSPDGRWVMDRVQRGDGGEWEVFVRPQDDGSWWKIASIDDRAVDAVFGRDELFVLSRKEAPNGRILRLALGSASTVADAREIVPKSTLAIEGIAATNERLWVLEMDGGVSGLRAFESDGSPLPPVRLPSVCAIDAIVRVGDDRVAYPVETFVEPRAWWVAVDDDSSPRLTALISSTPLDLSGLEVRRTLATSSDGTQVPISLIARLGVLDSGPAPTLLTGYGGYGLSYKAMFEPDRLLWLERGFVLGVANIRGGGEYGDAWHQAGRLLTKQNCFDDFAACAQHLVTTGVTTVDRLAIIGGSNGGLLMGAVLTQRPGVARAVVAAVPVLDMLHVENDPNGTYNVTEFGTVRDPDLFAAMYAYSPYHRVVDGTAYPAVLLTAGEFDPRVDAYHAKKMTARLQAATSSDAPVLLRMEAGGHGVGQSLEQQIGLESDVLAFVSAQLGLF